MRNYALATIALLVCSGCQSEARRPAEVQTRARVDPQAAEPEVLAQNLDTPWGIDFLPDGRMIFTERGGRVSILENGTRRGVGAIQVREQGEGGLLGIAVDPNFNANRYVFLYYTHPAANRVSRFVLRDGASLGTETIILDNIPSARFHNGGRLRFGPDGKLFITTGDAQQPRLSQDRNSLAGKILRINSDGSVPADNPFGNPVWAYGIRNSQGIAWHPLTGELFASDHGPTRRDEVNIIQRGGNYGWPRTCDARGDANPALRCYTEFTLAPCGMAFQGTNLFVSGLRGTQVRRLDVPDNNLAREEEWLAGMGRIRDVVARDGWLYVATSNRDGRGNPSAGDDKILRFRAGGGVLQ